jgi:hypothetical protein
VNLQTVRVVLAWLDRCVGASPGRFDRADTHAAGGLVQAALLSSRCPCAEKGGNFGFFLTTPAGSQGFQVDEFFHGLGAIQSFAQGEAPTQKLGPFSVLGFGLGGKGAPVEGAKAGDVRDVIQGKFRVAVFLMASFETLEEAQAFGKALPKLSID